MWGRTGVGQATLPFVGPNCFMFKRNDKAIPFIRVDYINPLLPFSKHIMLVLVKNTNYKI